MPNTLIHVATHYLVLGRAQVPLTVILAGCVIPDLPWILHRAYIGLGIGVDSISSYAFFVAQASLAMCLVACLAFGAIFVRWVFATLVASAGCILHLFLDSIQDKWGNGVHFLAPFDWTMFQMGVLSFDSPINVGLGLAGVLPFLLRRHTAPDEARAIRLNGKRAALAAGLMVVYLSLPLLLIDDVVESNSRGLWTLRESESRVGQLVELDREEVSKSKGRTEITSHIGEIFTIVSAPQEIEAGTYSVKARFLSDSEIRLLAWRQHEYRRDIASYAGLGLIAVWIGYLLAIRTSLGRFLGA